MKKDSVSFYEDRFSLLLNVEEYETNIQEYLKRFEKEYKKKIEFHITIIGFYGGNEIKKVIDTLFRMDQIIMTRKLKELIERTDWSYTLSDINWKIFQYDEIGNKESIIQLATVYGLERFYEKLNKMFGLNLKCPMTHVSLLTKGTHPESSMGIAIDSLKDFHSLKPVLL